MEQQLTIHSPIDGKPLGSLPITSLEKLPTLLSRAREAQTRWAQISLAQRADKLLQLRENVIHQSAAIQELLHRENGKPPIEALVNEIIPVADFLTFLAKKGPHALRDLTIPLSTMKHRKSTLNYWPLGVVAVISPWNFPFSIPFGQIASAVLSGNAVLFKPSEATPLSGVKIQSLFEESGFPLGLVQTLIGDGSVGAALLDLPPDKVFFTGSVATGKRIMAQAAKTLTPVNLELGGKDPMIVLSDADLDHASSAALWGGFFNCGQACASVERILVHADIAPQFTLLLKEKIQKLRVGPQDADREIGPVTLAKQTQTYEYQLKEARERGAEIVTGGEFLDAEKRFLAPTLVAGAQIESLEVYNEETFGPIKAITTFRSVDEAVEKANRSKYGLCASVFTRNLSLADEISRRLQAGTVTINEASYTHGLGETPWGGIKESGFGRSHSLIGLYEFVHVRHINRPRFSIFSGIKSPWWFPYTPAQHELFKSMLQTYRRGTVDKIKASIEFVWNLVNFFKNEKRY